MNEQSDKLDRFANYLNGEKKHKQEVVNGASPAWAVGS